MASIAAVIRIVLDERRPRRRCEEEGEERAAPVANPSINSAIAVASPEPKSRLLHSPSKFKSRIVVSGQKLFWR
jgi:hypothetical protein